MGPKGGSLLRSIDPSINVTEGIKVLPGRRNEIGDGRYIEPYKEGDALIFHVKDLISGEIIDVVKTEFEALAVHQITSNYIIVDRSKANYQINLKPRFPYQVVIFKKLGIDPAAVSAPFVSTSTDIISILVYFLLATWLLV